MNISKSYKQHAPSGHYDAIVVGSGMGGLTTAALLSAAGRRVLVLERHCTAGGYTHVFKRPGYEWDVGVHYIGQVHRPNSQLRRAFDHLTGGQLEWASMGEVYDRIIIGDETYDLHAGSAAFKEELKRRFPDRRDTRAIDTYVDTLLATSKTANAFFAEKAVPPAVAWIAGPALRYRFLRYARRRTLDVMRSITGNARLIAVLTGQYGDYGLPPGESSFGIHALLVQHYLDGASYPVGGAARIAQTIAPRIQANGGEILTNAEVEQILVSNGHATGVRLVGGKQLHASLVISDAGAQNTYGRLLAEVAQHRLSFADELVQLRPSAAHLSLYLGLKQSATALRLPRANYWIYPDTDDHDRNIAAYVADDQAPLPLCFISFPSAKDPDFERRHPDRATIEVITFTPYERFARWENKRWHKRGDEYEAYKRQLTERLLEQLYRVEPQVKRVIDHCELSTPLSTRHFTGHQHGEMYGLAHTPRRFAQRFLRPRTPIKGLFLTGQDVATCGVSGALIGGYLCASTILGRNLMDR